jgi:NitT/TauT family transport system substrate-binding protein
MTITLYEPFRAVFYTGFYAAHALEAYKAEGLDVRLAQPADPAGAAPGILAGEADVIWSGPMRLLQHHDRDQACALVGFAEVVTRDPFVLVGGKPRPDFRFRDLEGLRFGTVAEVPTPWMCVQEDIRRAGVDPAALDRVADQTMAANAASLKAGRLDVIQVFEPYVEQLVASGAGHIWYAAATRGHTSYTTLITTKEKLRRDQETALKMTRALAKTLTWLHGHGADEVAALVASYFPDLPRATLVGAIQRYKALGVWGRDPLLSEVGFVRLKLGLLSGGFIARDVPYESCVDPSFARQVIAEGAG